MSLRSDWCLVQVSPISCGTKSSIIFVPRTEQADPQIIHLISLNVQVTSWKELCICWPQPQSHPWVICRLDSEIQKCLSFCLIKGNIMTCNWWWEMSEEPKALKCYLIAYSSNQFDRALRVPLAVHLTLIIEQQVDGCVRRQERARPLTRPIDLDLRGGEQRQSPYTGIWLHLLRSFSQIHQDKLSLLREGITGRKKADERKDQGRHMVEEEEGAKMKGKMLKPYSGFLFSHFYVLNGLKVSPHWQPFTLYPRHNVMLI